MTVRPGHSYSTPQTVQDLYQYAVHVLYAIILTTSFEIAANISIPIDAINPIYGYEKFTNAIGLLLVYVVAISGWIGYTKSIAKKPHTGAIGNARFVVDVIIVFFMSYMINLVDPNNFEKYFDDIFLWVLPLLFVFFIIWDLLKYYEYSKKTDSSRIWMTFFAFLVILVQALTYLYFIINEDIPDDYPFTVYLLYSVISIVIMLIYRLVKWGDKPRSERIQPGPQ
jgi:hypothetical protein